MLQQTAGQARAGVILFLVWSDNDCYLCLSKRFKYFQNRPQNMQINMDDDAYRILNNVKAIMRARGIRGASLSDAVRELAAQTAKTE